MISIKFTQVEKKFTFELKLQTIKSCRVAITFKKYILIVYFHWYFFEYSNAGTALPHDVPYVIQMHYTRLLHRLLLLLPLLMPQAATALTHTRTKNHPLSHLHLPRLNGVRTHTHMPRTYMPNPAAYYEQRTHLLPPPRPSPPPPPPRKLIRVT